jgi:hypothetical protein
MAGVPPVPTPPPAPTAAPEAVSMKALDELVAPIALYPDPLVALILPASTVPGDIFAAQAYLVQYGDQTRIDSQPWDPSVVGLAHYPAVINWLVDNSAWTQALGEAFLASPPDVMSAIQRLRARALAEGVLASTAQQRVFSDNGQIEILPSLPYSIYVPAYDADAVFLADTGDGYGGPPINYGPPCDVGPWLSYAIDWDGGGVWSGGWEGWHGSGGWYRPHFSGSHGPTGALPWHPTTKRTVMPVPPEPATRSAPGPSTVPHPRPMQGAPEAPGSQVRAAGPAETRPGPIELRPGATDPRSGEPYVSRGERVGSPAPAKAPAAAPAAHPAPAQSAPAAARESSTATPDPRNH